MSSESERLGQAASGPAREIAQEYAPLLDVIERARKTFGHGRTSKELEDCSKAAGERESLAPETIVGQYRIVRFIGRGGMAEVYLVHHQVMHKDFAMKVLPASMHGDTNALSRFNTERRAQARLEESEHIVAATDAGNDQGRQYLVMRYVPGLSLKDYVERTGPLKVEEACGYVLQVAAGLKHAHVEGVVHRDIKPSNLLRSVDGKIKIVDWGVARILDDRKSERDSLTQAGSLLGTIGYLAPEQARDAAQADERSDLYSLGAVFFYLLFGRPPSESDCRLPRLQKLRPDLPRGVAVEVAEVLLLGPLLGGFQFRLIQTGACEQSKRGFISIFGGFHALLSCQQRRAISKFVLLASLLLGLAFAFSLLAFSCLLFLSFVLLLPCLFFCQTALVFKRRSPMLICAIARRTMCVTTTGPS